MSAAPDRLRWLRLLLLAAYGCLPLVTSGSVQEHVYVRVPYLLLLATIVWVVAAARSFRKGATPTQPPLVWLAAAWLGLAALSINWATAPALAPVAVFRDFVIVVSAGAFAVLAAPVRATALALLGTGALLAMGMALGDHFLGPDPFRFRPFYQPSLAGAFAAATLAAAVAAMSVQPPGKGSRLAAIGLPVLVIVAVVVLWRTSALTATGSAAAGALAGVLAGRGRWSRRLALLAPVVALLVGGGLILWFGAVQHHPSAHIRLLLWQGAADMFLSNPFGGIGYGGYGAVFPAYRPEEYWNAIYATSWTPNAHSLYLQTAAELGLAGLVLPLAFVGAGMIGGLRLAKRAKTSVDRASACAITGAFAAVAVVAIADLPADYPLGRFLFFALAGLANTRTAVEDVETGSSSDVIVKRMLFAAVAVVLIVQCAFVEFDLIGSRVAFRKGEQLRAQVIGESDRLGQLQRANRPAEELNQVALSRALALAKCRGRFLDAVSLPPFETQWTLRARLHAAMASTQIAAELPRGSPQRLEILRRAQDLCAQVEIIAPDFEDSEQVYAMIEWEMGSQQGFEERMASYLERRLGWDLRLDIRGGQQGPETPAWEFVLDHVPPDQPFFSWVEDRIAERAHEEARRGADWGAQLVADEVLSLYRRRRGE